MLYPMKFEPVYKEYIWGGNKMKKKLQRSIPSETTAESWDVTCHKNGMSKISNGPLKGMPLEAIFIYYKEALLGKKSEIYDRFPLLVKVIDAKERLSLQVHPGDAYAKAYENGESGKNEMWYVLEAEENSTIAMGLKENVTKTQFVDAIERGRVSELINEVQVKKGDVISIPAGLLHAIKEGIMIVEVQQNSDSVYRVHDWNRRDKDGHQRQLHIEKALDVIDFEHVLPKEVIDGQSRSVGNHVVTSYINNMYFVIDKLSIIGSYEEDTLNEQMAIYICLEGDIVVEWKDTFIKLSVGESILIPASLGIYRLYGEGEVLKASL